MDWIGLDQYGDRWWDLVNEVMNILVSQNARNSLSS
jgi:hypothetical protein